MIRLKKLNNATIESHKASLRAVTLSNLGLEFAKLPASMKAAGFAPALEAYLRNNIDALLLGNPSILRKHIRQIKNNFPWFHNYAILNPSRRSKKQYNAEIASVVLAVRKSFDYDSFSRARTTWGAYTLVKAYDLRLCPYCNLNHVNCHQDIGSKKLSTKKLEMRPPLDHYYPRANYPYLGISLHNLIPSCHQCNSGIKLQNDPLTSKLPHPFHFPRNAIEFTLDNILKYDNPVTLDAIKVRINSKRNLADRHINFFLLIERYDWYAHEIQDMHNRYRSYVDAASVLTPSLRNMVLGFRETESENRALGICLTSIFNKFLLTLSK